MILRFSSSLYSFLLHQLPEFVTILSVTKIQVILFWFYSFKCITYLSDLSESLIPSIHLKTFSDLKGTYSL